MGATILRVTLVIVIPFQCIILVPQELIRLMQSDPFAVDGLLLGLVDL